MKAKIEAKKLKKFVEYLLKNGYSEGNLIFSAKGLEFYQVSPDLIALVQSVIPKSEFSELEIKKEEQIKAGVSLEFLARVLKEFKGEIEITIEGNKLIISGTQQSKAGINLIEVSSHEIPKTLPEPETTVAISKDDLQEAVKKAMIFNSETVILKANGSFIVEANSPEFGEYREVILASLQKGLQKGSEVSVLVEPSRFYNLISTDAKDITISIEKEKPIKIKAENLTCWIAPKLE